jgi:hypothetical protein
MSKYKAAWNSILIMASVASGLLIIPPEAKARMIASRMQSGKAFTMVRRQLCSEIMQQQIRRFGLSQQEARQIQAAFSDERVIREMVQLENQVVQNSEIAIEQNTTSRLLTALLSSVEKHVESDLKQKFSDRAERIPNKQRLIASRFSTASGTIDARKVLAQAQRALTAEMLVALGMAKKDAAETLAKLKDRDIDNIFKGNLRIGYSAGIDFSSDEGLLLLVIIILGIAAIIAGGAVAVIFLVVVLIALVYYLAQGHW